LIKDGSKEGVKREQRPCIYELRSRAGKTCVISFLIKVSLLSSFSAIAVSTLS